MRPTYIEGAVLRRTKAMVSDKSNSTIFDCNVDCPVDP